MPNFVCTVDSKMMITVDYSLTVEKLVAAGHYETVHTLCPDYPSIVSSDRSGELAVIVHFNSTSYSGEMSDCIIFSREVVAELNRTGLRPGNFRELLAVGAQYPDLQREFSIVALGSMVEIHAPLSTYFKAPAICHYGDRRVLTDVHVATKWLSTSHFLAIRK